MMKAERMIPNIYEQSSDMRTVCRLFDAEAEILEYYTDHILDCYSPEHCPDHLVEELAEHIGFKYQDLKTLMYNRVVLKNFIKYLIRYRGSATGIRNAAAIDIRYRQTLEKQVYDPDQHKSVTVQIPLPMIYNEAIDVNKTWIDTDADAGIIYLFIVVGNYFKSYTSGMSDAERAALYDEHMRKLLDLAYLQEYVRPVGMYLLPMVARKVNPHSDLTVKAVRIPEKELHHKNNVYGVPNASMTHEYDRMLFAKTENPDDELDIQPPWVRTLYHSQLAGRLTTRYFTAPVMHIEGKFLYYDHDELLNVYEDIIEQRGGYKIGDALYNPNRTDLSTPNYTYGDELNDGAVRHEPLTIQEADKEQITQWPLNYVDNVGFPDERVYELAEDVAYPVQTSPDSEFPIYLDTRASGTSEAVLLNTEDSYTMSGEDDRELAILSRSSTGYLKDFYTGTHQGTPANPGDDDDGTNKNLMLNLYTVNSEGQSEYTGASDIQISGKVTRPSDVVPYDPETNDGPFGEDLYITVTNPYEEEEKLVP